MRRFYFHVGISALIAIVTMVFLAFRGGPITAPVFSSLFAASIVYTLYDLSSLSVVQRQRLAGVLVSGTLFVLGYAGFYALLDSECAATCVSGFSDSVYFSIVTATTLGYGDFAPAVDARLMAAIQAITGYVFLGFTLSFFLGREG